LYGINSFNGKHRNKQAKVFSDYLCTQTNNLCRTFYGHRQVTVYASFYDYTHGIQFVVSMDTHSESNS